MNSPIELHHGETLLDLGDERYRVRVTIETVGPDGKARHYCDGPEWPATFPGLLAAERRRLAAVTAELLERDAQRREAEQRLQEATARIGELSTQLREARREQEVGQDLLATAEPELRPALASTGRTRGGRPAYPCPGCGMQLGRNNWARHVIRCLGESAAPLWPGDVAAAQVSELLAADSPIDTADPPPAPKRARVLPAAEIAQARRVVADRPTVADLPWKCGECGGERVAAASLREPRSCIRCTGEYSAIMGHLGIQVAA